MSDTWGVPNHPANPSYKMFLYYIHDNLGSWPKIFACFTLQDNLGGGCNNFLCSPLLGEMIQFDSYFPDGLKPPTSNDPSCL